mgnify:CR=1 FL=1
MSNNTLLFIVEGRHVEGNIVPVNEIKPQSGLHEIRSGRNIERCFVRSAVLIFLKSTGGAVEQVRHIDIIFSLLVLPGFTGVIARFSGTQRDSLLRLFQEMFNDWDHSLLFRI